MVLFNGSRQFTDHLAVLTMNHSGKYRELEPPEPWVLEGDFNAVRFRYERNGGDNDRRDREEFNSLINELGPIDLPLAGNSYTWSNMRAVPALAKLDKILVSESWESHFPTARGENLNRLTSDHSPIGLFTGERYSGSPHIFRFEKMWISDPDLYPLVQQS